MYRHLPSLSTIFNITNTLVDYLLNREAPPDMGSLLSVLSVYKIPIIQSSCGSNNACMFSERRHVERYFAFVIDIVP